jgi:Icc-related predicted phosphoesterase
VVVTGDISHHGDVETLTKVIDLLDQSRTDTIVVPGNHDLLTSANALQQAVKLVQPRRVQIGDPRWLSLESSVEGAGAGLRFEGEGFRMQGPIGKPLAGTRLAIWLTHFPVRSRIKRFGQIGLAYAGDAHGIEAVWTRLHQLDAPTLILSGHLHASDSLYDDRTLELSVAASVEPPFEVAMIDINDDVDDVAVRVERVSLDPSSVERLPVLVPIIEEFRFSSTSGWVKR